MTYTKGILIAIDQLGNALAGGNPDCTISGRTGYFQENGTPPYVWYWHMLAFVVDITFYPWDGHHHCREAYKSELDEDFNYTESVILLFILSLITLISCSIMIIPFWVIYGIKTFFNKITIR